MHTRSKNVAVDVLSISDLVTDSEPIKNDVQSIEEHFALEEEGITIHPTRVTYTAVRSANKMYNMLNTSYMHVTYMRQAHGILDTYL